jgi:hypothetical protein
MASRRRWSPDRWLFSIASEKSPQVGIQWIEAESMGKDEQR